MGMGKTSSPFLMFSPLVTPYPSACPLTLSQGWDTGFCEFGSRSRVNTAQSLPISPALGAAVCLIHSCSVSPFCKFYEVSPHGKGLRLISTADDIFGNLWAKPYSVGGQPIYLNHVLQPSVHW